MTARMLVDDLKEGGFQGNYYVGPDFEGKTKFLYRIRSMSPVSFQNVNRWEMLWQISTESYDMINCRRVFLKSDGTSLFAMLSDERAPQELVDVILAQSKQWEE
ncbi:hypothetical protein GOV10_03695 [Candidatus Woesearchaeota archaeon]|nr:hypothetical protein [Candidatus Woesearchaeota archaeon]